MNAVGLYEKSLNSWIVAHTEVILPRRVTSSPGPSLHGLSLGNISDERELGHCHFHAVLKLCQKSMLSVAKTMSD